MANRDDKLVTVPKFGSFKSKSATSAGEGDAVSTRDSSPSQRLDEPKRRDRRRHGHNEEVHKRLKHDHHDNKPHSPGRNPIPAQRPKESGCGEDELFVIDHRGDPLILRYGSNDRSRVPAYRRDGLGKVMGATGFLEIHHSGTKDEFTINEYREGGSAFRDKRGGFDPAGAIQVRRIKPSSDRPSRGYDPLAGAEDFLPLNSSARTKRTGVPMSSRREGGISGFPAGDVSGSDSDGSNKSSELSEEEHEVSSTKRKSMDLSRRVKDHPEDVDAWLDLVALQQDLLMEDGGNLNTGTADEARGIGELKLSMLETALLHAVSSADRERILLALMREGAKVWDTNSLAKRWLEISQANPDSFAVWMARLDSELANISRFTFEALKDFQVEKLQSLEERILEASPQAAIGISLEWIYLFLRITRYLWDAGYSELSVAAWQALLELTFARAVVSGETPPTVKSSLSDFWESEVSRIGENGALGWSHFTESKHQLDLPESREGAASQPAQTRDVYKAWASAEQSHSRQARMPARTMDEGIEDDPYRVVMFSDIEPLLVFFPASIIPNIKEQLLDAFLLFCGLPPANGRSERIKSAFNDPFINRGSETFQTELEEEAGSPSQWHDLSRAVPKFVQDGSQFAVSPEVLFAGRTWFRYLVTDFQPEEDRSVHNWALLTMRQLVRQFGIEELAEYSLAMEWLSNPSNIKKAAKTLLRQYPSNLSLYNAYALIEWSSNNPDVARKVLSSVVAQDTKQSSRDLKTQFLWNTWAWMELEDGRPHAALGRLCSSVAPDAPSVSATSDVSSALVLKARSTFASTRDYLLSSGNIRDAATYAEGLMLVEYLAADGGTEPRSDSQGHISAALSAVTSFSDEVVLRRKQDSVEHERFLQSAARLLYFHSSHGPFRPTYLQEQLRKLIYFFPQNTMFLNLFAWADSSFRIDDPVRQILSDVVLARGRGAISSQIFSIQHELRVGTVHSARVAFERALETEACRSNPWLWKCYIRFCYQRNEFRSKAKEVFYRGVGNCPWSKELIFEAFTTLVKDMASSELRAVYSTVSSKGLRIHVELDEFVKQWHGGPKQRSERKH